MVATNLSVSMQLAALVPALTVIIGLLVVVRDPEVSAGELDRGIHFPSAAAVVLATSVVAIAVILTVYFVAGVPTVLPDHNLVESWEIDYEELGYTREEALERESGGYLRHGVSVYAYMTLLLSGNLQASIYRMSPGGGRRGGDTTRSKFNAVRRMELTEVSVVGHPNAEIKGRCVCVEACSRWRFRLQVAHWCPFLFREKTLN